MPVSRNRLSGATPARVSPADLRSVSAPWLSPGQTRQAAETCHGPTGGAGSGLTVDSPGGQEGQKWRTCGEWSAPVITRDLDTGKVTGATGKVRNPAEWSRCHLIPRTADRGAKPSGGAAEGALSARDRERARMLTFPKSDGGTYREQVLLPEAPIAATPKPEMKRNRKRGKRGGRRGRGKR